MTLITSLTSPTLVTTGTFTLISPYPQKTLGLDGTFKRFLIDGVWVEPCPINWDPTLIHWKEACTYCAVPYEIKTGVSYNFDDTAFTYTQFLANGLGEGEGVTDGVL